eukprot:UN06337
MNWLKMKPENCAFGQTMMKCGISAATISAWSTDPQVVINSSGEKGSCFDALEDMSSHCTFTDNFELERSFLFGI